MMYSGSKINQPDGVVYLLKNTKSWNGIEIFRAKYSVHGINKKDFIDQLQICQYSNKIKLKIMLS